MSRHETLATDYDPYREFYERGHDGGDYRPLRQVAAPRRLTVQEKESLSQAGIPSRGVQAFDYPGYSGERCTVFRTRK